MNTLILFRTSIRILLKHKVRSLLTLLGIMIGIMAIIVTFSIGRGAEIKIKKQILSMGEGATFLVPGNITERMHSGLTSIPKLTFHDLEALDKQSDEILHISRGRENIERIEYGTNSLKDRIMGVDANMINIINITLGAGNFFTQIQLDNRANVAVLGRASAKKLFGIKNPINETIHIGTVPFTVIGVLAQREIFRPGVDPNYEVYIPFSVADKYFRQETMAFDDVSFIAFKTSETINHAAFLRKIKRALRLSHGIGNGDEDDFLIFDQRTIARTAEKATSVIQLFGLLAASISLLVGGIGVMNIMLVSVQERTKEIGIRLALGATQRIVQAQFLIEAVVLSSIGGFIGVILGIGIQQMIIRAANLPGVIEIVPLALSFLLTVLVGIFFGFYPARKASMLNPVDALQEK